MAAENIDLSAGMAHFRSHYGLHRGSLQHRCGHCHKSSPSELLRCSDCRVVRYCSEDHQQEDYPVHKAFCSRVKEAHNKVNTEADLLRKMVDVFEIPPEEIDVEETPFWNIPHAEEYIDARGELARLVGTLCTLDGITENLEHLREMLRLCRIDHKQLRFYIPPLLLLLDRDQEAYDFVKWWQEFGDGDYFIAWYDVDTPILHIHGADVLEDVQYMKRRSDNFMHLSAILLLKMKLLVDIANIQRSRRVSAGSGALPAELWIKVERHIVRSPISLGLWVGKADEELSAAQHKLEAQAAYLIRVLQALDDRFISGLFHTERYIAAFKLPPEDRLPSQFDQHLASGGTAWQQHEGVLELLKSDKFVNAMGPMATRRE